MDILPIIFGFALIISAGGLALFYRLRRESFKSCCRATVARVVAVKPLEHSDSSWPDYRLTLDYEVGSKSQSSQLTLSYWTLRSSFPALLEPALRGGSSVPIVVDPQHPRRIALDSRKVQESVA